jgi:hypothetical protein
MSIDDIINTLKVNTFPKDDLDGFYRSFGKEFMVRTDGRVDRLRMATRREVLKLIMFSKSPLLDKFRDWTSQVLADVMRQGYHVDPRLIAQGPHNDPIVTALDAAKQSYLMGLRHEKRIEAIEGQIGRGMTQRTLAAYLDDHGIKKVSVDVLKEEGRRVRAICKREGFIIPEDKVCNGGNFMARMWPIEALDMWFPGFKQRYGID